MTENKVEKTFYRLIVSIILLMLIGCLFTSYIIIRGKLSESLNREGNLQLAVQKEYIENYISNTKSIIEFLAKQETVINASLLDVTNKSDVVYFFKEQNLFPKQASFYILDFEGEEIIRSNEDDEDISNKIVEIIVNSEQSSLINAGKNKDFSYLKFSSPIIFRGSLEGYLVVKVPINYSPQLFQYAETQHYAMEVFYKNTPLLTYGNIESNLNNAVSRTSSLVNGLEIKFWVSKRLMNEAINELIRNIFVFAILVSFLILYFSRRFGKKHILAQKIILFI